MFQDEPLESQGKVQNPWPFKAAIERHTAGSGAVFSTRKTFLEPDVDLSRLADTIGYTRNQMSNLLNQVQGQSFYQYLSQKRVDWLLERLKANPELRPNELAFMAGFNRLSVFYHCFRERTAMSPKDYVKQLVNRNY